MPRLAPAVAIAALALAAAPVAAARPARWRPHVAAARHWAEHRAGTIAFAVRTRDGIRGVGLDRRFPSASVVKALLLVAYLNEPAVRRRPLTAEEGALLAPMIRHSSNSAADAVWVRVGDPRLRRLARRAGMHRFRPGGSLWGLSQITARDITRFFLHVDRLLPPRHRAYGMRLLRSVTPSQRWGIASVVPRDWRFAFKGGWGSGTGWADHQAGLLTQGRDRIAIAVLTYANPSHAYGNATERGVARRLLAGLSGRLIGRSS
ncbi:MAG TPA: serine hydrolase [Solirubrobacteraceae bacterium]|nr:serine hydrolase [Solirubrobacteraceae bacterium]